MIKLGLISAILPDMTFEEVIDYCSDVGFSCVEICCWPKGRAARRYAGVTHIDITDITEQKMAYYNDYAAKKGIFISSLAYYPNPLDPDAEAAGVAAGHLRKLIEVSAGMGINTVTTFIGRDKNKTVEENLPRYKEVWSPIVEHAEKHGVRIGIENCPMLYTENEWPGGNNIACTPHIWREMFRLIPSGSLGLNYDPSHLYLLQADYIKPLYEFKDKIFHVHFKDIEVYKDALDEHGVLAYPLKWHKPKLPGLGGVNFGAFVAALDDIGYKGPGCIEIEDRAYEACVEDVKFGIERSYRYMKLFV